MIKIPNKDKCKRKVFIKNLKPGLYVYLQFMDGKSLNFRGMFSYRNRDMKPRPKLLKVIDQNHLQTMYFVHKDSWVSTEDNIMDNDLGRNSFFGCVLPKTSTIYNTFNIWAWFQRDEIRNIQILTKEEVAERIILEEL